MRIIPVIDIQDGVTVRGVAGQRESYRPLKSLLTESVDPSVILQVLQQQFGLGDFYVADLDAIRHQRLNRCVLAELQQAEGLMYCDAGVQSLADAQAIADLQADRIVLGLESVPSSAMARELLDEFGEDRLVFSLDMQDSVPLCGPQWQGESILDIFDSVAEIGFSQFIVLDLASVGTESGITSLNVCRRIREQLPGASILCGGGVRHVSDLTSAEQAGVDGVLVASALHDRSLTPEDVRWWQT